jgi:hypothetical protein
LIATLENAVSQSRQGRFSTGTLGGPSGARQKRRHETVINQIRSLKQKLFPNNGLQERTENFIPYLLKYGDGFVASLIERFEPFDPGFLVLVQDSLLPF